MHQKLLLLGCLIVLPGLMQAAPAGSEKNPPDLQVQVDVPATVDPMHEDDVAQVFVDSLRDAFRRRGYEGRIDDLYRSETPRNDVPLIFVRLLRWERTRTGGIDCSFYAAVTPAGGEEQSLGSFNQHELGIAIGSRWTLAEAFRDAAERAAEDMYRRLEKLSILPGISRTD